MIPPVPGTPPHSAYRRRMHYVDSSIQRSLLVAMVALEVTLVAAAIWFAYWRLIQLIEESMYRMNVAQNGSIMQMFAAEGFWVLGLFAVVNLIAVMVAAGIWSRHENHVLQDFTKLVWKTRGLDFSSDSETPRQHEVLALTVAWRVQERERFAAIREQVARLEAAMTTEESMQISVDSLNKLLPQYGG